MSQLHGKRLYAAESENADRPFGLICLLSNSLYCGFGIGAMFVLALAKREITRDVIKKMDTALCWRKRSSLFN